VAALRPEAAPLDAYLREGAARGEFSGTILLRVKGQTLLEGAYGLADRASGRPITLQSEFQIASVSKSFGAAAILLLEERGRLSVHDLVDRWIRPSPPHWAKLTVHDLMAHTAGLVHWRDLPELDLFRAPSWERLLEVFARPALKFAPGDGWAYSSPGYRMLAEIVGQAGGEPYARFLEREIFRPLGLSATRAGNRSAHPERAAVGYFGGEPEPSFELDTANCGAGDIWSTTGDLARWNSALETPGRLLSGPSLDRMFAAHAAIPPGAPGSAPGIADLAYGYGWYLGKVSGFPLRFHPGDNPGFRALNLRVTGPDVTLVVLTNEGSRDLTEVAFRALGSHLRPPRATSDRSGSLPPRPDPTRPT
jgi:CubicO group peptidase (beta-lactamase class C family)